ncbi:hypothetical protein [Synechococcus sp. KORDI-100]|uniref:hypothetical protein n=1 Tax=Synechococcus sp. KORDI-100 TaxID=1280380 RepID=UPI0012E035D8|nr:hypothetical protein [Synechococcus sp. KORDI-100]
MTLTLTNFQMKLFTSIAAAAAVIGTSFIAANPAEARNGWMHYGTHYDNSSSYVKVLSRNGAYANVLARNSKGGDFYMTLDCSGWRWAFKGEKFQDVMPGSYGENLQELVCQ